MWEGFNSTYSGREITNLLLMMWYMHAHLIHALIHSSSRYLLLHHERHHSEVISQTMCTVFSEYSPSMNIFSQSEKGQSLHIGHIISAFIFITTPIFL